MFSPTTGGPWAKGLGKSDLAASVFILPPAFAIVNFGNDFTLFV
jgi:hypothetical protein